MDREHSLVRQYDRTAQLSLHTPASSNRAATAAKSPEKAGRRVSPAAQLTFDLGAWAHRSSSVDIFLFCISDDYAAAPLPRVERPVDRNRRCVTGAGIR